MSKRTVVVYNPIRFTREAWLPVLWAQAKTYYERHGQRCDEWTWAPCYIDIWSDDFDRIKLILEHQEPDVFAVSLYVWNYQIAHRVAQWVKQRWPRCLVITGGPHQYFKHDQDWFRKHPYIDASLPGECYGEICFQEVLDNLGRDGTIDWDHVSDVCYPRGKSRLPTYSKRSIREIGKKNFDYNWAAFAEQIGDIKHFIQYVHEFFPSAKILSIFETTRGCPYGCTYCDWGGGINSAVIKKPVSTVKRDIDAVTTLDLEYLYFADANFGMFGDRDIEILEYVAQQRRRNVQTFTVGYGGFAKTENRLDYIREILRIDLRHQLSILGEIKISMQSLSPDVLRRIDRKNIGLERQIEMVKSAVGKKKLPIYVELIYGLPGMTLDQFYDELDTLGELGLSIQWYPWILLPEAPAYSREYRQREAIRTLTKTAGWWAHEDEKNNLNEIVVSTSSYTSDDYLEMLISSSAYKLFVQGGFYSGTMRWLRSQGIGTGRIIQEMYRDFYTQTKFFNDVRSVWQNKIMADPEQGCFVDLEGESVYLGLYFVAMAYLYPDLFVRELESWLMDTYSVPGKIVESDRKNAINCKNFGKRHYSGWFQFDYTKDLLTFADRKNLINLNNNMTKIMIMFMQFKHTGAIMTGQRRLLGIPGAVVPI